MDGDQNPLVSIVIAIEGEAERVPTLMAHLERQAYPASRIEIVLVIHPHAVAARAAARHSAEGAPIPTRILVGEGPFLTSLLNQGIRAASGEYVLLLDEELLPSPHWVEQHMAAMLRAGGHACTVGTLLPHPQLEGTALTAWFMSGARTLGDSEGPLGYLDWRRNNLCLPRAVLLESGGFSEQFVEPQFADAELAYRLSHLGLPGLYVPRAVTYVSYATTFEEELQRHYRKGKGLFRLFQMVRDPGIFKRYRVYRNPVRRLLDAMFVPFYVRACLQAEENTHLFGHVYKRVFFYQRALGYRHAMVAARSARRARAGHRAAAPSPSH
jgi:glycosyltransferase involved in cell wall biosynthesis